MVDTSGIRTDWQNVSEADWQVNNAKAQANKITAETLNALGLGVIEALSQSGTSGSSNLTVVSGSVTLDDGVDVGTLVGYRATASTTFTGQGGSVVLVAGAYIFERVTGGWTYRTIDEGTGLTPPAPDTTNPTAGTLDVTGVTDTEATLTVTGASDDQALHASPYAFSTDNGATWTSYQASNVYAASGLTPSTSYTFRHRVRDAAGNVSTGTAVTQTTTTPPPGLPLLDTFTAADDTPVVGRTVSGFTWRADTGNDTGANRLNGDIAGKPWIKSNKATGDNAAVVDVGATNVRVTATLSWAADAAAGSTRICLGGAGGGSGNTAYSLYALFNNQNNQITLYGPGGTAIGAPTTATPGLKGSSGTVVLEYDGTTATLKWNGTVVGSGPATVTGSVCGFATPGAWDSKSHVDDFQVEAL